MTIALAVLVTSLNARYVHDTMGTWRSLAACINLDTESFWENEPLAAETCGSCCVQSVCLAYAMEARMEGGIWGGMKFDEGKPKPLKVPLGVPCPMPIKHR